MRYWSQQTVRWQGEQQSLLFVVADSYDQLFGTGGTETAAVRFDSIRKRFGGYGEPQVEDIELEVVDFADSSFVQFLLDGLQQTRYVGVFWGTAAIDSAVFLGKIRPEYRAEDYNWQQGAFTEVQQPQRRWRLRAQSLPYGFLDVEMKQACQQVTQRPWWQQQVQDRLGYFDDGTRQARFSQLVDLGFFLNELLAVVAQQVQQQYGVAIAFQAVPSPLPVQFLPTLWRSLVYLALTEHPEERDYGQQMQLYEYHYCGGPGYYSDGQVDRWLHVQNFYELGQSPISASLFSSGTLFFHAAMVQPPQQAEQYSFWRFKTVKEFLFALGEAFLVKLHAKFLNQYTVELSYKPLSGAEEVRLIDAERSEHEWEEKEVDGKQEAAFAASSMTPEGSGLREEKQYSYRSGVFTPSSQERKPAPVPLVVAPSVCRLHGIRFDRSWDTVYLPQNVVLYENGQRVERREDSTIFPQSQHATAALYVKFQHPATDTSLTVQGRIGYGVQGRQIVSPVGAIVVKNDEQQQYFEQVQDLLRAYRKDREHRLRIVVPGLDGGEKGGVRSWRFLQPGYVVRYRQQRFVIVEAVYKLADWQVELTLEEEVVFQVPQPGQVVLGVPDVVTVEIESALHRKDYFVAGEAIAQFEPVRISGAGTVMRARNDAAAYGKVIGIALSAAQAGEQIPVLLSGVVHAGQSFAPGRIFLGEYALTQQPPLGSGRLFQPMGMALGNGYIRIEVEEPVEVV